jgi:hypothetical protein
MTLSQSPTARKTQNPSADNRSDVVAPGNVEKQHRQAAYLLVAGREEACNDARATLALSDGATRMSSSISKPGIS